MGLFARFTVDLRAYLMIGLLVYLLVGWFVRLPRKTISFQNSPTLKRGYRQLCCKLSLLR